MIRCGSCKNKSTDEQCSNRPLKGLIFCGKHVKVKNPRMWNTVNHLDDKAIKIQKLWRGYSVRDMIRLAGPGALNRSVCHNDEELVTLEDKKRVSPLEYFAFEENSKVYWFDIKTVIELARTVLIPKNPYTREPLSIETRQRLRKIRIKRWVRKMDNSYQNNRTQPTVEEVISISWINVCQIIEENGFFDMSHLYFTSMNRTQLLIFNTIFLQDLVAWAAEHDPLFSVRYKCIAKVKTFIKFFQTETNNQRLSYMTAKLLVNILNNFVDNYALCFMIMSALHRI